MAWLKGISTKTLSTLCLMLAVLLAGCDMMDYHPYDVKISGETGLTKKHIALIEKQCAGKDTIRFAQISDTQRWYDETEDMITSINEIDNLDFVIHTGDQADFGLPKEYEWMRSLFSRLKVPYVCVIGNHDCIGSGESSYKVMYGPDNFSFNASFLHFVMLNTNAYEYDYSDGIPNFAYIKNDLETLPDSITNTIVAMHVGPFMYQFNDNVADYFNYRTMQYPGLLFCICGHEHKQKEYRPFGDSGPIYYECGAADHKTYIIYTVTKESYTYEIRHA